MLTNYWRNKLMDANQRGQSITFPSTRYTGLFTVIPTPGTGGTECAASGYGRIALAASMANWSGTQGAGTTVASSGTTGEISNNVAVTFSSGLAAAWSGLVGWGQWDASSGGNLLEFGYIVDAAGNPITRSYGVGDAVVFAPGSLVAAWS